jgi:predicted HTH domain antitoxin
MTLNIPNERIGNLKLDERDLITDIAIGLYKREEVSFGRAAENRRGFSPKLLP